MSFVSLVKARVESLPEWVGRPLSRVPYALRLGPEYSRFVRNISRSEVQSSLFSAEQQLRQLQAILNFAAVEIPFYRDFYRARGFAPSSLKTWNDWEDVPIVTKADLQSVPLSSRVAPGLKGTIVNTGGTSGQPLEFCLDRHAFAREWAHMHYIWKARGYCPSHLKLTFRGKHFDRNEVLRYNAVHNEYVVNANSPMDAVIKEVASLPPSVIVRWLHGYPSLIAEFSHALGRAPIAVAERLRQRLFGVLLGSEFPAPIYLSAIEQRLSSNVVSWYGHSEMALLARETGQGVYHSMPTYGYAEAVPLDSGSDQRLICTSLHNRVHPFIRYDTGDLVESVSHQSGSLAFRITEGRVGDFIEDKCGMRHSLTAIIFGRHHEAFKTLQHVQVKQNEPGVMTLVVTPCKPDEDVETIRCGFDLNGLDIDWRVEKVAAPVRTVSGKIRLKIS